ncbi:MAG: TIGR03960 family B12-binding radical SAM protein [Candidatus Syntrophosphaera sp.]|nr:TIGR03960 family B12-binding radical SAM protein [Candidatus Syntrophosphaera sp.]
MDPIVIEPWLPLVAKPSRYLDHEINAVRKPFQPVNFCFAYPDVYEVGISHLGLKILYSIINRLPGLMADRCYLPWLDMIQIMRREGIPLFGIESRRPILDFDLLGITLQSELTFSNVLETLDLAGIPLLAKDREEQHPIVMAGGPCATNPLPLADFIDVFFIGEAEEGIQEIAEIFSAHPERRIRLEVLANLDSCFVPVLHLSQIQQGWKLRSRKFAKFGDFTLTHEPQLLPWQLSTHNRCVAEIMRGCSRGCRFCHAGYFYRPVRERASTEINNKLVAEIRESGWDEAGLLSLSSSDYSRLRELLDGLLVSLDTDKTHISLPSLRVDSLDAKTIDLMRELGREGLTIAPEAGTTRLRDVINKNLSEEQILAGVGTALELGWQKVKLYFMLGLPSETDEDVQGIVDLIEKISAAGGKRMQVNVTLSPFVPKPFTPFQWAAMLPAAELLRRCLFIKQSLSRQRRVKIKYHTIEASVLEAFFSRGDELCGEVLLQAWRLGARFDGWHECFDWQKWSQALAERGIDLHQYLRERDPSAPMPWDFVDTGVAREFLLGEWKKAQRAEPTPDCREVCGQCGVCGEDLQTVYAPTVSNVESIPAKTKLSFKPSSGKIQYRHRIWYSRTGILRFISHLDWMRMLFRLISKAPLDTVFTQGFSPHPKVSLSPPLPLGVESQCEFFDISFHGKHPGDEIIAGLSQAKIPDFRILKSEELAGKAALPIGEWIEVEFLYQHLGQAKKELDAFAAETERIFTKSTATRSKSYDLRSIVVAWEWRSNSLWLQKSLASPALYDVLAELFKLDKTILYTFKVIRRDWVF